MKKIMDEVLKTTQGYTDKILDSINPALHMDLPFIALSLKNVLRAIEGNMDDEQKCLYKIADKLIGTENRVIRFRDDTTDILRNFDKQGGGIINGI